VLRELKSMRKELVREFHDVKDLIHEKFKEVLKKEKQLLDKLQNTEDFILQDKE
jgi:hypothetical protein